MDPCVQCGQDLQGYTLVCRACRTANNALFRSGKVDEIKTADQDTRMPFGKHRGKPLSDVPTAYLAWLADEMDKRLKIGNSLSPGEQVLYDYAKTRVDTPLAGSVGRCNGEDDR